MPQKFVGNAEKRGQYQLGLYKCTRYRYNNECKWILCFELIFQGAKSWQAISWKIHMFRHL